MDGSRPRLLLGTTNPAKLDHLRRLLDGLPVAVLAPAEVGGCHEPEIEEGAASILDNAVLKARAWAAATGLPTLATDGGLDVPALGERWRTATTRRAAGAAATPAQHAAGLLDLMRDLRGSERVALSREAAALVDGGGRVLGTWQAEGSPREVATCFDPRDLPPGFWLPGVLLYGPARRRFADLAPGERLAAEDHWGRLARGVRAGVAALAEARG